jgi:flagellar hook-basal body complex protein FliE
MTRDGKEQQMNQVSEERPQFAVAIRGYDRLQVDEYIARLVEMVAEADQRAREAEADLEYSRHTNVGPRVAQIFDLAVEEVRELRKQAAEAVEQLRKDARTEADEILTQAYERADEAQAQIDAYRERGQVELAGLEARKAGSVRELHRLQEALAAATELVSVDAGPVEDAELAHTEEAATSEATEDGARESSRGSGRARRKAA